MNFIIETKTELTEKDIASILVSAFEAGGIKDWATVEEIVLPKKVVLDSKHIGWVMVGSEGWPSYIAAPLLDEGYVQIADNEDDDKNFIVNRQAIARGLHLMANGEHRHHFNDILDENHDINTADILIQLSVFGEVKYC